MGYRLYESVGDKDTTAEIETSSPHYDAAVSCAATLPRRNV